MGSTRRMHAWAPRYRVLWVVLRNQLSERGSNESWKIAVASVQTQRGTEGGQGTEAGPAALHPPAPPVIRIRHGRYSSMVSVAGSHPMPRTPTVLGLNTKIALEKLKTSRVP